MELPPEGILAFVRVTGDELPLVTFTFTSQLPATPGWKAPLCVAPETPVGMATTVAEPSRLWMVPLRSHAAAATDVTDSRNPTTPPAILWRLKNCLMLQLQSLEPTGWPALWVRQPNGRPTRRGPGGVVARTPSARSDRQP